MNNYILIYVLSVVLSKVVDLLNAMQHGLMVDLEVLEQAILEVENPPVHNGEVILLIALLHGSGLDDVPTLLDDAQLDQAIVPRVLGGDRVQLGLVQAVHVADVAQPRVQQAQVLGRHGGLDAAAPVVPAHHDVLDAQVAHRVLDHRHGVQVRVDHQVRDVPVDERLPRLQPRDLLRRDPRVRAPDPEVLRRLPRRELLEEGRVPR